MNLAGVSRPIADRVGQPPRVVSTIGIGLAVVTYATVLAVASAVPAVGSVVEFLSVGVLLGLGYLRRDRLLDLGRGLRRRWGRFRDDGSWSDESAHDWGPDEDRNDESEEDDDGSGIVQVLLSMTAVGTWMVELLWADWFVALVFGACGVVLAARLLAWASPVRDRMEPPRRGVPACPSDRSDRHSPASSRGERTEKRELERSTTS